MPFRTRGHRGEVLRLDQPLGGGRQLARGDLELGGGPLDLGARGAQRLVLLLEGAAGGGEGAGERPALEPGAQARQEVVRLERLCGPGAAGPPGSTPARSRRDRWRW
jgi:hypothetical protein